MTHTTLTSQHYSSKVYHCNTAIVGTGAAGYNAAHSLWQLGQHDILILTEDRLAGTSRNTGSDKQTYYKLTLSGTEPDSVGEMAQTLFSGQCVDGDIALCEAANSAQCFLKLAELGVPFPRNRYGEYIGYKTDHDPRRRATSVGPYTSRQMTQMLEKAVMNAGIPILDKHQVIHILTEGTQVLGLLCLNLEAASREERFVLIQCKNVIYATGGPAGMYANSVYPESHFGATGIAFEAGVIGRNLTEWQYGMASVHPRWNVSGSYMQVLPRIYSCEADGSDEREFLLDFFSSPEEMLSKLFLKGYQWPFDVRKVNDGSSVIDILVYLESCKGRSVYLDYRTDPAGGDYSFENLQPEVRDYLQKAGVLFHGTPFERLVHMNFPAVDFYRDHGIDLATEPLQISLCAQHNNGGLAIDCWWQTNLQGFFAAGEVAASHGVYRPGGSALNAGQVGSFRAAQYIARHCQSSSAEGFESAAARSLEQFGTFSDDIFSEESTVEFLWQSARERMSLCAAAIRSADEVSKYLSEVTSLLDILHEKVKIRKDNQLGQAFRLRDMLICQKVYLSAMADYIHHGGKSRGSALYTDYDGIKPYPQLPDTFTFALDDGSRGNLTQEIIYYKGSCQCSWRPVRAIPQDDDFFENVWRSYRENGNIL